MRSLKDRKLTLQKNPSLFFFLRWRADPPVRRSGRIGRLNKTVKGAC